MPCLEITVTAAVDGQPLSGFPIIVRLTPAEVVSNRLQHSGNDGNSYVSVSKLATENGIILFTDTNLNVALQNATADAFQLFSGGFLLLINGQLAAGSNENVLINNNSGQTANITFVEVGP